MVPRSYLKVYPILGCQGGTKNGLQWNLHGRDSTERVNSISILKAVQLLYQTAIATPFPPFSFCTIILQTELKLTNRELGWHMHIFFMPSIIANHESLMQFTFTQIRIQVTPSLLCIYIYTSKLCRKLID